MTPATTALALVLGASSILQVRESVGGPTQVTLVAPGRRVDLGSYPTFGGNMPFVTDLRETCELLVLEAQGGTYRLISTKLRSGKPTSGVTLLKSERPLWSPRWSAAGNRIAVIQASERGDTVGRILVLDRGGKILLTVDGDQAAWTDDDSLVVHVLPHGAEQCRRLYWYDAKGNVSKEAESCSAANPWLPDTGLMPKGAPVVIFKPVGDNYEVSIIGTRTERLSASAMRVAPLDSPSGQAVACDKGVSFATSPVLSLETRDGSWVLTKSDVCGLDRLRAMLEADDPDKRPVRRIVQCTPGADAR